MFDHRGSIVAYLENLANKKAADGQQAAATELRAAASSVAAGLDAVAGIITPVQAIVREVVTAFDGISSAEVLSPDRGTDKVVRGRRAAMWVAKRRLGWSDERLGEGFGRDRTTISHGVGKAETLRAEDEEFRQVTDILFAQEIVCPHCLVGLT